MKQQRNTKQRQLVSEAVRARCSHPFFDHPTADMIYLDTRAVDDKISRGTVYRNLSVLVKKGELLNVKAANAERYDCRLDYHYHLLCTKCGALRDAPFPYHELLDREAAETTGYTIARHRTVFEGLCPDCRHKHEPTRA
jgi:Fur family transcriptional regulator, ferric uptake regulator